MAAILLFGCNLRDDGLSNGEPDAGLEDTDLADTDGPDRDTGEPDTGEPDTGEPDTGEPDPCGGCGPDEVCVGESCVCTAPSCEGVECGEIANSCATASCGGCEDSGLFCIENHCVSCSPEASPFGAGDGSELAPYQVCSWEHWMNFAERADDQMFFELHADLENPGGVMEPIQRLRGSLDGRGHSLTGIEIDGDSESQGLFRWVRNARIEDLILISPRVTSAQGKVGALAGEMNDSLVRNVHVVNGQIVAGWYRSGGLIGEAFGSEIYDSSADVEISGHRDVGGLVGRTDSVIRRSWATGTITNDNDRSGGLVGIVVGGGTIEESWADATVSGEDMVGGLAGEVRVSDVSDAYALGTATGASQVGGVVGFLSRQPCNTPGISNLRRAYGFGLASGSGLVGGLVGDRNSPGNCPTSTIEASFFNSSTGSPDNGLGTPLSADEFGSPQSFPTWDFGEVWIMESDSSRPRLHWE